ncbi:BatA domain-containing protein [Candidatus Woesearchaeota archaeon]|nr:BatA domain-containing protein [Candidatus Woesearchaeota archaeon]
MAIGFENILGLWALLALIPLIILYLIKPKPQEIQVPSLMFFIKLAGSNIKSSFLRNILRDLLFIFQFLAIALIALSFAEPYIQYEKDVIGENLAFIIDISASSQVNENGKTRFDLSLEGVEKILGNKNNLILAKSVPLFALKQKSKKETMDFLTKLKPTESKSKIGDAIIMAGESLEGDGRVVVFSDFINTEGISPIVAKNVLESKGIKVDFINTGKAEKRNFGIVNLNLENDKGSLFVKNFNDKEEIVKLRIGDQEKDLKISPNSVETLSFQPQGEFLSAEILNKDDFAPDNKINLVFPEKTKLSALLITNKKSIYLESAVLSSGLVRLDVAEPPVIPTNDYDVYVISSIDKSKILAGTFEDLAKKVENGAGLIIHVQEDSSSIGYKDVLNVNLGKKQQSAQTTIDQVNKITRDIEIGRIKDFFAATLKDKTTSLISTNNQTVLSIANLGKGRTAFFNVQEANDFKFSPSYPILISRLVEWVSGKEDVKALNYKTGDRYLTESDVKIETPVGTTLTNNLFLEYQGIYKVNNKKISANLISEQESGINVDEKLGDKIESFQLKTLKKKEKKDISFLILILGGLFVLLELIYAKLRGDF